jgi:hypothetical protein
MRIASLGKDLRIHAFRSKLISELSGTYFEWGGSYHKNYIPLDKKNPPNLKCLNIEEKIYQITNGHAYFIDRNNFVIANDRKKNYSNLLICVGLRLKRDHKGKCIIIENETKRLFYDYKVVSQKYPDFCFVNSFVFIKSGEKAILIDYLPTGEYSEIIISQSDVGYWYAERKNTKMLETEKEKTNVSSNSSN